MTTVLGCMDFFETSSRGLGIRGALSVSLLWGRVEGLAARHVDAGTGISVARCPSPAFFTINTNILAQSMSATPYLRRQLGESRPVSGRGVVPPYEQARPRSNDHAHLCHDTTSSRISRGCFGRTWKYTTANITTEHREGPKGWS